MSEASTVTLRKPGSQIIAERFPDARALWSFDADRRKGFSQPFTMTAYSISGRLVLVQEFGESHGNSWDVFVSASDSGEVAKTLNDLETIVNGQPVECRTKRCSYFQFYLAYGPAELTHEGYHAAEKICAEWQKRASDFFDAHPQALEMPEGLKRAVAAAEARVRA